MYLKASSGIIRNLLYLSPNRRILYVTDVHLGSSSPLSSSIPSRRLEHLSCFLPGLLALGAHELADEMDSHERDLHLWAAEGLTYSCWLMYADQPSGLAPEEVLFERPREGPGGGEVKGQGDAETQGAGKPHKSVIEEEPDLWYNIVQSWKRSGGMGKPPGVSRPAPPMPKAKTAEKDYFVMNYKYLLRPETIESIYVMWRTTGDEIWRERGWEIFLAIEAACRQPIGYSSVRAVDRQNSGGAIPLNEMPSYALAETWKYLYLLFLDYDPLPMDKWVFNTEAHPFPVFQWSERSRMLFGLT